jgi:hypothetical protein
MTSDRLTSYTGSLIALDELIEQRRMSAAVAIEAAFQHDIRVAIVRIGEFNNIASARISATAEIAVAKVSVDAEVSVVAIASCAQDALSQLVRRSRDRMNKAEDVNALIKATSDIATEKVTAQADKAAREIKSIANDAIQEIRKHGEEAVRRMKAFADTTKEEIDKNSKEAQKKLIELKSKPRIADEVLQHAIDAENALAEQYKTYGANLDSLLAEAESQTNSTADQSIAEIYTALSKAEKLIATKRDAAIGTINEFAAGALR